MPNLGHALWSNLAATRFGRRWDTRPRSFRDMVDLCPYDWCKHGGEWHTIRTFNEGDTNEEARVICLLCMVQGWKEEGKIGDFRFCAPD